MLDKIFIFKKPTIIAAQENIIMKKNPYSGRIIQIITKPTI